MIKRLIIPVCIVLLGSVSQSIMGQNRLTDRGNRLLDECRTLFTQGDYAAAGTLLEKWEQTDPASNVLRTEKLDYMRTVIAAQLNPAKSLDAIQAFMDRYPGSMYLNRMQALLGTAYFAMYEFDKAVECFDETDPLLLDDKDCCRMVRHNAISLFRTGRTDEGRLQMSILEQMIDDPETDSDIVFYKAFMDYRAGKTEQAVEGFNKSLGTNHND